MAGYYDPNKDYSKELQRTDLSDAERAQLTQERQNKIADKYGGVEPVMTGSDKTYSQIYGSSSSGSSSSGSSSSGSSGIPSVSSSVGKTTDLVNGPGYVTGGYTTGVYGSAILGENSKWQGSKTSPDMSRRLDLAGKTAVSNGYTVYYNEDGYAVKATKGATDYLPSQDLYVKNGTYNGGNLWTDEESVSAADLAAIQNIRARMNNGELTAAQANQLANQIRSTYGYTIDTAGNVYDSITGASVAARRQQLGLDTGTLSDAQQQVLQMMFPEQQTSDTGSLLNALYALHQGTYSPYTQYTGTAGSGALADNTYSGLYGSYSGGNGGGYGDMTDYINDLYAQQLEAELAALKSAYDSNVAEVESQNDRIAEQYRSARNQVAAQNALETQRMNELGIAQGLNTGATGQTALAQNAAYQGNLGNLWAQEAQEQADIDLMLAQLQNQYNSSVQQSTAKSNAQRTQALMEEMVRQQELAAQQQALSREYALNLISNGVMPDSSTLASAGISGTEASALVNRIIQQDAAATTPTTGSTSTAKKTGSSYNNGSLTASQVQQLQNYYGVTADGKWGTNSTNAAGGLSADEAWAAYNQQNSSSGTRFSALGYQTLLSRGDYEGADAYLSQYWGNMTDAEKTRARIVAAQFGG